MNGKIQIIKLNHFVIILFGLIFFGCGPKYISTAPVVQRIITEDIQQERKKKVFKVDIAKKISRAQLLKSEGLLEESHKIVKDILSYFPAHPEALKLDRELTFVLKEEEEARLKHFFERKEAELKYQKALKYMESGDYIEAILNFEDVSKLIPNYKQVSRNLEESRRRLRKQTRIIIEDSLYYRVIAPEYKKATGHYLRRHYKGAHTGFKKINKLIRLELVLRYLHLLNERMERDENFRKAQFHYEDGVKYHREGNLSGAKASLNRSLKLAPHYHKASHLLNEVENIIDREKGIKWEREINKRFRVNITRADNLFNEVLAEYLAKDTIKKMIEYYEKKEDKNTIEKVEKAIQYYKNALLINEDNIDAKLGIQKAKRLVKEILRRKKEVEEHVKRKEGITRIEQSVIRHYDRGIKNYNRENYKQALKNYRSGLSVAKKLGDKRWIEKLNKRISKTKKKLADKYYVLGYEFFQRNKFEEALEEFRKVVFYDPENMEVKRKIREVEEKIIQINKRKAERVYNDGLTEYSAGNIEKAIELWEKSLKYDAGYREAQKALERAKAKIEIKD